MGGARPEAHPADPLLHTLTVLAAQGLAASTFLHWNDTVHGEMEIALVFQERGGQVLLVALAAVVLGVRRSFGRAVVPGLLALVLLGFHYLEEMTAAERLRASPPLPEDLPFLPPDSLMLEPIRWRYGFVVACGCALLLVSCSAVGAFRRRRGRAATGADRFHALGLLVPGLALTASAAWPWWEVHYLVPSPKDPAHPLMAASSWGTSFLSAALAVVVLSAIALLGAPRVLPWTVVPAVLASVFAVLSRFDFPPGSVFGHTTQPGFSVGVALLLATVTAAVFAAARWRCAFFSDVRHTVPRPRAVLVAVTGLLLVTAEFLPRLGGQWGFSHFFLWGARLWPEQVTALCGLAAAVVGFAAAAGRTRLTPALVPAGLATGSCVATAMTGVATFIDFESRFLDSAPAGSGIGLSSWKALVPDIRFVLVVALSAALLLLALPGKTRNRTSRDVPFSENSPRQAEKSSRTSNSSIAEGASIPGASTSA